MKPSSLVGILLRVLRRQAVLAYLRRHPVPEDLPERLVQEPADGPARAVLLWLHGTGTVVRKFLREHPPPRIRACRVVALQAPIRPVAIFRGHRIPVWADMLPNGAGPALSDMRHMAESAARIHREIDLQRQDGIGRIVLGGHSQGAFLALYAALTCREPVTAVVSLSGYLSEEAQAQLDAHPGGLMRSAPVFLAHGTRDATIPLKHAETARDWLRERQIAVHWHSGPYGHNRRPKGEAEACAKFLRQACASMDNSVP